jgi:hypothetical protein
MYAGVALREAILVLQDHLFTARQLQPLSCGPAGVSSHQAQCELAGMNDDFSTGTGLSGCTPRLHAHAVRGQDPRPRARAAHGMLDSALGWLKETVITPFEAKSSQNKA